MTSSHHVSFSCSWPGGSLRLSWFEWPQWFGGGLGSDAQTVPLLACLMFFSLLVWACGFGEEDHRGEVPFSSRPPRAVLSTWLLTFCPWPLGWGVSFRCHLWGVPLSFSPFPSCSLWGGDPHLWPTLKGSVFSPSLRGQYWHKLFGMLQRGWSFLPHLTFFNYLLISGSTWGHSFYILGYNPKLHFLFCCSKPSMCALTYPISGGWGLFSAPPHCRHCEISQVHPVHFSPALEPGIFQEALVPLLETV